MLTLFPYSPVSEFSSFRSRLPKPQQEQGDSSKPDWTVYVLQNMESTQLYKAVVCDVLEDVWMFCPQ